MDNFNRFGTKETWTSADQQLLPQEGEDQLNATGVADVRMNMSVIVITAVSSGFIGQAANSQSVYHANWSWANALPQKV